MKNNVIELPKNYKFEMDFTEHVLMVASDLEYNRELSPILKSAKFNVGGDCYDKEFYLERSYGDIIFGKHVCSVEVYDQKTEDGEVKVFKEYFITGSGKCLVFYTTYVTTYSDYNEEQIRFCRSFSDDQELSYVEKWGVLFGLGLIPED